MSQSDLVVIDLKQLIRELDEHYVSSAKDEYTGCCQCGEPVTQDVNRCTVCGRWIVWLNSDVWDQKFRVEAVGDPAAAFLLDYVGVVPKSRIKQWYELRGSVGDDALLRIANDVVRWAKKDKSPRNGIIPRVMNLAKKETRKHIQQVKPSNDDVIPDFGLL
jgi:hypothetical protein